MKVCKVQIRDNVGPKETRRNLFRSLSEHKGPELMKQPKKDGPIALVCSGPSLEDTLPDLRQMHADGVPILCANGAHDWLIERGIIPTWHAMLDRRERMAEFVRKARTDVTYLVASHCHPEVFAALRWRQAKILMWHCHGSANEREGLLEAARDSFTHIQAGCTIGMHMLVLSTVLGHSIAHLFGYDGCFRGDQHHATDDKWTKPARTILVGGRKFLVDNWMLGQAEDFQKLVDIIGRDLTMVIHGDGLLSWIATLKARMRPSEIRPGMQAQIAMIDLEVDHGRAA